MKNLITVLPLLAAQLFFMMPVPLHAATPDDSASGKVREVDWSISMYGFGATEASLPFWAVTNRHGIFPDAHGGLVTAGVSLDYSLPHSWYIDSKVSLAGSAVPDVPGTDIRGAEIRRGKKDITKSGEKK